MDQWTRRAGEEAEDGSSVVNMCQVEETRNDTAVAEQRQGTGNPYFTRLVSNEYQDNKKKIGKPVFHASILLTTSSHLLQKRGYLKLFPTYRE